MCEQIVRLRKKQTNRGPLFIPLSTLLRLRLIAEADHRPMSSWVAAMVDEEWEMRDKVTGEKKVDPVIELRKELEKIKERVWDLQRQVTSLFESLNLYDGKNGPR